MEKSSISIPSHAPADLGADRLEGRIQSQRSAVDPATDVAVEALTSLEVKEGVQSAW